MAEVKMRLNLDAGEVELVVDGQVALASGSDVFANWVSAYNNKHKPVEVTPVPTVEPVVPAEPIVEAPVSVETPVQEVVAESPTVEVAQTEGE